MLAPHENYPLSIREMILHLHKRSSFFPDLSTVIKVIHHALMHCNHVHYLPPDVFPSIETWERMSPFFAHPKANF